MTLNKLIHKPDIDQYEIEAAETMREYLNAAGWDAEIRDIILAWRSYSEDVYHAGFMSLDAFTEKGIVGILVSEMEVVGDE